MRLIRGLGSFLLVFTFAFLSFLAVSQRHVIAQESNTALARGYRTGYSDGYMAGYRDILDNKTKDFASHPDYNAADRAYNKSYGPKEDYRDGYQQGFESGYAAGFDKKDFDSTVPTQIMLRGTPSATGSASTPAAATENNPAQPAPVGAPVVSSAQTETPATPAATTTEQPAASSPPADQNAAPATTEKVAYRSDDAVVAIAKDTELILELQDVLSTDKSKPGDKFTAKVVSPSELSGAIVEGRIDKIERPGRVKKRAELALSFDRIVLDENRWSNFSGILTEVLPVKGDNVYRVDNEGTAVGKSSVKPDTMKVGAATGTGATVGAVAGGPVGAAVGAGVGAAFGVGAVVIERGKDIHLNVNQQLRVKSAYDTRIR
jgi:hypothetical protein